MLCLVKAGLRRTVTFAKMHRGCTTAFQDLAPMIFDATTGGEASGLSCVGLAMLT
jgi:hypothetical protein